MPAWKAGSKSLASFTWAPGVTRNGSMKRAMRLVMSSAIVSSCVGPPTLAPPRPPRKTTPAALSDPAHMAGGSGRAETGLELFMAGAASGPDVPALRGRSEECGRLEALLVGARKGD